MTIDATELCARRKALIDGGAKAWFGADGSFASFFQDSVLHRDDACNTYCDPTTGVHAEVIYIYDFTIPKGRQDLFEQRIRTYSQVHGVIFERCLEIEEYARPVTLVGASHGVWEPGSREPTSVWLCWFRVHRS